MQKKTRFDLVPDEFVEGIAEVFEAGIKQGYEEHGWKGGKEFDEELNQASIKRHLRDRRRGIFSDAISGLHPLLHVATRALMQYYLDEQRTQSLVQGIDLAYFVGSSPENRGDDV